MTRDPLHITLAIESQGETLELSTGVPFPSFVELAAIVGDSLPSVRLRLEVEDGVPVITRAALMRQHDGPPITAKAARDALSAQVLDQIIVTVAATSSTLHWESGLQRWPMESDDYRDLERRALEGRARRTVNNKLLQEVASVYSADQSGAPTEAVGKQMHTSHRNATRWVALARKRGFLPPYGSSEES